MQLKRKISLFFMLLFLITLPCHAGESGIDIGLGISADVVQDLILRSNSKQVSLDFRIAPDDYFEFRIPLLYTVGQNSSFIESGFGVFYYPFTVRAGFFLGISVLEFGKDLSRSAVNENFISLNEMILGWTFVLPLNFFIEAGAIGEEGILITDPEDINHIRNVLRMRPGEELWVSDGESREYHCGDERFPGAVHVPCHVCSAYCFCCGNPRFFSPDAYRLADYIYHRKQ